MPLAFGPEAEREIDEIAGRYPERMGALIPVLYVALREFGVLSDDVLDLVAKRLDLPPAKVLNTATFYTMLHRRRTGRVHVQVCRTVSCFLRGSDRLLACAERKLGVGPGETTADGRFSLEEAECLAACGTAPVVRVGERYHEGLTPEAFERLLDELARTVPASEAA